MFKSPTRGFSIIEAVVAITILMIGIVAVANFFPISLKIITDSEATSAAANLALSKIEEVQGLPYNSINIGIYEAKHSLSEQTGDYLSAFQRSTSISYLDGQLTATSTDVGMKKISVTVYWQSSIGHNEKSLTLNTIRSNY